MAIGMTYDQYWYGDPTMVRAFYEAHKLRLQHENEMAWMYGTYTMRALDATVGNMFREKSVKPSEYPKEPINLAVEEEKQKKSDSEELFALAYMQNMVMAGKNWKKR